MKVPLLILLFCSLFAFGARAQDDDTLRVQYPFKVLGYGKNLPVSDGEYIFNNQPEYLNFWFSTFGSTNVPPGPVGDNDLVLIISRTLPSAGHNMAVYQVIETRDRLYVTVKIVKSAFYNGEASYRYLIVKMRNPHKKVSVRYVD